MDHGRISYKKIDSRCEVSVRELNRNKTARRLIAGARPKRGNAGLIVTTSESFEAGALVEIDIKFPGQEATYRSRGIVDYVEDVRDESGVLQLAVAIFGIDKLDPNAAAPVAVEREEAKAPEPSPEPGPAAAEEEVVVAKKPSPATVRISSPPVVPAEVPVAPPASASPASIAPSAEPPDTSKPPLPAESAFKLALPDGDDVGELLSGLVDGEVTASVDSGQPLATKRYAAVGEYVMDDGEIGYLMVGDLKLLNRLGSALVMLPKAESEAAIENNRISDEVRESFQEILNIATGLMNTQGNPHSRFQRLYLPGKENLPDPVTAVINRPGARIDFQIEVPGYGQGRLCILDRFRTA